MCITSRATHDVVIGGFAKMPPPDCQLCEDTAATLFCKQCQENFCQEVCTSMNPLPLLSCLPTLPSLAPCQFFFGRVACGNIGALYTQCFDALHYSGKRQGHEVTPVQPSAQSSPAKPPPSSSAPIGEW